jgi:uncharacterized protein (TIGR04222 family)
MNPFAWSGPNFLGFYLLLAIAVLAWCWFKTRFGGHATAISQTELTADPYRIAYLRGGRDEAIRVAVFNLVDRGLVFVNTINLLEAERKDGVKELRRALDRAIVGACVGGCATDKVAANHNVASACIEYERELTAKGLLPDAEEKRSRKALLMGALAVLGLVAVIKILVAIASGRSNVWGLAFLGAIACITAIVLCNPRLSATGRHALNNLRTLLKRLQANSERLRAGGATNEALLLAAVAGLYALPEGSFAFIETLYPKPKASSSGDSASSDGGSSCSSSCGGGGGCGGCGG